MTLKEAMDNIKPASQALRQQAEQCWDQVAKPLGSLGALEGDIIHIVTASGSLAVSLRPRVIVVVCRDNGVVKKGVAQTGQGVIAIVVGNMARGNSCVCLMTRQAGADVVPVDMSMTCRDTVPGAVNRKVAYGTKDSPEESVMIMEEIMRTMEADADVAMELKERGYVLAGLGEMGIDNTATSSALPSVLFNMDPKLVTGRGASLTTTGCNRKVQAIRGGICIRKSSGEDPVDALSEVGGLDLVALTDFYVGCTAYSLPAVLDGLITGTAALAVVRISPDIKGYLLISHVSAEPVGVAILGTLGPKPAISVGMYLGEGTSAAALFPLLDMATAVCTQMSSFDDIHVDACEHLL